MSLKSIIQTIHRSAIICLLFLGYVLISPRGSFAALNQFGETGLLSTSTAETLGGGNICVGIWCDVSSLKTGGTSTIAPFSVTFGMSKNTEISGTYPSLILNDNVDESGRGTAGFGFKTRFIGTNRSLFKLSISGSMLKSVSDKSSRSGLTDYEAKVLAGFRIKRLKLHFNAGYRTVDDNIDELNTLDDEIFAGAAIDFSINRRLRAFVEYEQRTNRIKEEDDIVRVTPGLQIYLTPNATLSGGVDFFLSDTQHEWRAIVGLSTCGGLGEYVVPIPKPKKLDVAQVPKGRPPIPLLPEMIISRRERMKTEFLGAAVPMPGEDLMAGGLSVAPVSKYEVALTPGEEELIAVPLPSIGAPSATGEGLAPIITGLEGMTFARAIRKFRIPELMFDYNSWALKPGSALAIKVISEEMLSSKKGFFVKVEGHTDNVGASSYNEKLSLQRATAVAEIMVDKYNIPPENMFIEGYGESRPIDSNETAEGRSNNRRVDILLIQPE